MGHELASSKEKLLRLFEILGPLVGGQRPSPGKRALTALLPPRSLKQPNAPKGKREDPSGTARAVVRGKRKLRGASGGDSKWWDVACRPDLALDGKKAGAQKDGRAEKSSGDECAGPVQELLGADPVESALEVGQNACPVEFSAEQPPSDTEQTPIKSDDPDLYDDRAIEHAKHNLGLYDEVAERYQVPRDSFAGPITDEYNAQLKKPKRNQIQDFIADKVYMEWDWQDMLAFDERTKGLGKLSPLNWDIGPGNIKIRTAIELAQSNETLRQVLAEQFTANDEGNFQTKDIVDYILTDEGTANVGAAYMQEAMKQFAAAEKSHHVSFQDNLLGNMQSYYKQGPEFLDRALANSHPRDPEVDATIYKQLETHPEHTDTDGQQSLATPMFTSRNQSAELPPHIVGPGDIYTRYTKNRDRWQPQDMGTGALQASNSEIGVHELMLSESWDAEKIRAARLRIEQVQDPAKKAELYRLLQSKVQYANQRDNQAMQGGAKVETAGGQMCNLTSLAMALQYLGIPNPYPEMQYEDALERIRQEKGFEARTGAGWEQVAKHLGVGVEFLLQRGANQRLSRQWYETTLLPRLSGGSSAIMSINGHIVRVQDVTDGGLVVDDPYGQVKLGAGTKHSWKKSNSPVAGEGDHAGEDNVWPWPEVEAHKMWWVAVFRQ